MSDRRIILYFEVNRYLMIYLLVIGILLELIYLGQQYMKKFRYYKEMTIKLDMLDQKNMLSEMMERPDFLRENLFMIFCKAVISL